MTASDPKLGKEEPDMDELVRARRLGATDPVESLAILKCLAERGSIRAAASIGEAHRKGMGTPVDLPEAMRWYEQAANRGHVQAAETLGLMLLNARNPDEAVRWLKYSAARGRTRSMYALGVVYGYGKAGVKPDHHHARDWLEKAMQAGDLLAKDRLGKLLLRGHFGLSAKWRGLRLLLEGTRDVASLASKNMDDERLRLVRDIARQTWLGRVLRIPK